MNVVSETTPASPPIAEFHLPVIDISSTLRFMIDIIMHITSTLSSNYSNQLRKKPITTKSGYNYQNIILK